MKARNLNKVDAFKADTDWHKAKQAGFGMNRSAMGTIFSRAQNYLRGFDGGKLSREKNGLKAYDEIRGNYPEAPPLEQKSEQEIANWFREQANDNGKVAVFRDYSGKPLGLAYKRYQSHSKGERYTRERRPAIAQLIPDIVQNPDEVFLQQKAPPAQGKMGNYILNYLKFYGDKVLLIEAEVSSGGTEIRTWYQVKPSSLEQKREGVLVHINSQ